MKEIKYNRKAMKVPILWEKTYYSNDLIDESRTLRGEETGKWSGICFLYRFLILKGSTRNRFIIEPYIEEYHGESEKKMVVALEKMIEEKEEWVLEGKHWKEGTFPQEVNEKLLEFNLEKYVKKIS